MHPKNGFTFIEVLIVLSILGIVLLIAIPLNDMFLEDQREKQFIRKFSSDMLLMQAYSRTTLSNVRFLYSKEDGTYKINKGNKVLIKRDMPENWSVRMRSYEHLQFSFSGAINELGYIVLETKNNAYEFIFPLGKGRFRIEKR